MILPMLKWLPYKHTKMDSRFTHSFHRYASVLILMLTAGLCASLYWHLAKPHMDFYNNLWAPVNLLVHGLSPYYTSSLETSLPALWFPTAVGLFSPFGLLRETIATKAWFVLNVVELFTVVWLCLRGRHTFYITALICFMVFLFPPVINHIALGQISIPLMFSMVLAANLVEKKSEWVAAFFVALGLAKPQLGILALPGLGFYYFHQGGLKSAIQFGAKVLLMAILMSLPLFIAYPSWIPDWLASWRSNSYRWPHPSLFSILSKSIGEWGYVLWGLAAIVGLAVCYQLWKRLPAPVAMLWSLGLTPIITPYVWSWDFVLLIPIWVYSFATVDWMRKGFLFGSYWIGWLGIAFVQKQTNFSNQLFWWVPIWFFACVLLVARWKPYQRDDAALHDAPVSLS